MQQVKKKQRRSRPWLRWVMLAVLLLVLAAAVMLLLDESKHIDESQLPSADTYGELMVYEAAEVTRVAVTLPGGEGWTLIQAGGTLTMLDEPGFALDRQLAENVLDAARVISYSNVLAEEAPTDEAALAEFGLDQPVTAAISYADGMAVTLRIGSRSDDLDTAYYYMTIDGDKRLFALDVTTANTLSMERYLLHAVTQPVIHKARIDAVTLAMPDRTLAWQLEGSIEEADAADRWLLTSPERYPADGEHMTKLRENLSNLRLGAYVAEATEEALQACGFDAPQLVLTIHQGAGTIGQVDSEGVYGLVDWPESTLTITVGGAKSEYVDYIRYEDCIYITSHFSLQTLMNMDARSTLTRYPVLTSLSNLETLTIERDGTTTVYAVTREEMVDVNGETILDDSGSPKLTGSVTENGEPISYDAFEAAYNRLLIATVSGTLPDGWQPTEAPHTLYTFTTRTGVNHTIALTPYDALHDAVTVDGCTIFYIFRNGLELKTDVSASSGGIHFQF